MPESRSVRLAGTAVLGAMVIVLDYSLKFSGLKIPFPWLPVLKFDFTGLPVALSLFLYGLPSGGVTSAIAFLGIVLRSGDFVGASMKALAEFSTVLGIALFPRKSGRWGRVGSFVLGMVLRVVVMTLASLVVFPVFYGNPLAAVLLLLPLIGVFNLAIGFMNILLGYLIYEAVVRRVPSLVWPRGGKT
jgi:riboflavin transporter FmnP